MTTFAEFMIIAGADNRPPMLEKSMYDSWKSRMELYIKNRENMRIILNSVLNGPLGLPLDVYAIVNHHKVTKEIWDRVKLLMQGTKLSLQKRELNEFPQLDSGLAVLVFTQGDDPIVRLNKAMAFLSVVAALRIDNNAEPNHSWRSNAIDVSSSSSLVNDRLSRLFSGTVRFENDQIAKIMSYGDYQLGNVTISRVYYVEGLGHNLFLVGEFYDSDLEVAFWKTLALFGIYTVLIYFQDPETQTCT
uniref:Integrase, catalytic region, zinc finger, CCHC-type, peptidase aspartic, catalytic n=1 Tax=Tanacetum cinerariifolium TaxID=118510 RepID=A0A6L2LTU1_TANCI|nr:integrase, catalytic region, zinc finger, CCHC-type, peptidase aspartic, catalytic [Tanacetum cinerariifolium]